jgi:hypothetical protein
MTIRATLTLGFLSIAACMLLNAPLAAQTTTSRPDLSGLWTPAPRTAVEGLPQSIRGPAEMPYTELGRATWDAYAAEFDPVVDAPGRYCVPPGMPTVMIGTPTFPMEIFHRDHDVTIFNEAYYQYRKVYLEGYERPEPILPTRMGYAVGRWDGDTLIVETSFLSERGMAQLLMSDEAHIVERIHVQVADDGRRVLVDDITLTDPQMYTAPIVMRGVWLESPDSPIMEYICSQNIFDDHINSIREAAAR